MNKNIILFTTLFALFFISNKAFGQCTPDVNLTKPGISPDTIPNAVEGQAYAQVVSFLFPTDTVYMGISLPIDSASIKSISGFPSGFSYSCNNSTCVWPGGTSGCMEIIGNPGAGSAGAYTLDIVITIYTRLGGNVIPYDFSNSLPFKIEPASGSTGIQNQPLSLSIGSLFPNPNEAGSPVWLNITSPKNSNALLSIYTMSGQLVLQNNVQLKAGVQSLNLSNLPETLGMYQIRLETEGQKLNKLLIQK